MTNQRAVSPSDGPLDGNARKYDGFISYSHVDIELAADLQSSLQRFSKPWWRRKPFLRMLRDDTAFGASSDLANTIHASLDETTHLVVILSPDSARSEYVDSEVQHWLATKGPETITFVISDWGEPTEGVWPNLSGFAWDGDDVPPAVRGVFTEPLAVDLRWAIEPGERTLRHKPWRDDVADIAAGITGKSKDELIGEILGMAKRARILTGTLILGALILLGATGLGALGWLTAEGQRKDAQDAERLAQEAALVADSAKETALAEQQLAVAARSDAESDKKAAEDAAAIAEGARDAAEEAKVTAQEEQREADEAEAAARAAEEQAVEAAGIAAAEADRQQALAAAATKEASRQLAIAEAVRLAIASGQAADTDVAALLALESVEATESLGFVSSSADAAVYAVAMSPWRLTLRGHAGVNDSVIGVGSASYSPDGKLILTESNDGTARLWDATTGVERATITGHGFTGVQSARFSPDGSRIVTTGGDDAAKVWDVGSSSRVWDGTSGALLLTIPRDGLLAARFGPNGSRLLTEEGSFTDIIGSATNVWDATSGALILGLEGGASRFSPDGTRIVTIDTDPTVGPSTATVWDANTGSVVATFAEDGIVSADFSQDGSQVVTGASLGATVWDAANGIVVANLVGHMGPVTSVEFGPSGSILTIGVDGTARQWRVHELSEGTSVILDATFGSIGAPVVSAHFDSDGFRVVWASAGGAIVEDAAFGLIASLEGHTGSIESAEFSPDGSRVVTAGGGDSTAKVWRPNAAFIRFINSSDISDDPLDPLDTFSDGPDGSRLEFEPSSFSAVRVLDRNGAFKATLQGHTAQVLSARFTPDGSRIITSSHDGTTKIWHPDGTLLATLDGKILQLSADGSRITTTIDLDQGGLPRIWSVFSLSAAVAELEHRLGGRQLTKDECVVYAIDPCPED